MTTDTQSLSVGTLAKEAGCNVETVRYYEKAGLMPEPSRTPGGHRLYTHSHLQRLCFIRRGRELGFPVVQVRELLRLVDEPDHTCGEIRDIASAQIDQVRRRIEDLQRLQEALNDMMVRCRGGAYSVADCPIVEALFSGSPEPVPGAASGQDAASSGKR